MTGLVSLARKHKHVAATHYEGCEADHIGCLVNKLADEIEGLRAQLEDHYVSMRVRQLEHALDAERQTARWLRAEIERQRVENERLRAALIDIARQETTGPYKWQSVVEHLCEIAREALEGEP